jgi:hypothetical protein
VLHRRLEVGVNGLGERRCEALFRRGLHHIHVADEHFPAQRLLRRTQHERRLAVPPRRVDEHVLAVPHVRDQLPQLALAVGERLVEREVPERERVRQLVLMHS